jgi:5-formyltetrahydrofolate cyclo-ligase
MSHQKKNDVDVEDVREAKKVLRRRVKKHLQETLTDESMASQSDVIASKILGELKLLNKNTRGLTIYIACERLREVDTSRILHEAFALCSPAVYLPRVLDSDSNMHFLRTHKDDTYDTVPPFGIQEPTQYMPDGVTLREDVLQADTMLDIIFMPGLAFGTRGERLGRGGGYYDNFIDRYMVHAAEKGWTVVSDDDGKETTIARKPLLVGLAFDEQIFDDIPLDSHDQRVDIVVTPSKIYYNT